jgi:uncharacterized protein YndB with AHSA1/START domain
MTTMTETTTQVYEVFIKATPEQIFEAITNPAFTQKYFYGTRADYDLRPGGKFRFLAGDSDDEMVDGEVLEVDPPRRLVQTWRFLYDPELTAEGYTNVTWAIDDVEGSEGVSKLTVTHALEGAAKTAASVAGGWSLILSGLKTLLETGKPLA